MSAIPPGSFAGNDSVGNAGGPWDDVQGRLTLGDAIANPTYEAYRDAPWKCYFFRHDQADEMHFAIQMTHAWDPTTDVRFHLHIIPMVNPPTVPLVFAVTGYYSWAGFGVATPAAASWIPFSATSTIGLADAFKEAFCHCFTATAPGSLESSVLLIYLKRDVGGADTYTTNKAGGAGQTAAANVAILAADVHYQKNKDGTYTEVPQP